MVADGSDAGHLASLVGAITKAKGKDFIVAPKVGGAKLSDGKLKKADGQLAGSHSQLFDAVALVLSKDGCASLINEGAAVQWVMDAYGHLKAIGASDDAKPLLEKAGVVPDNGVTGLHGDFIIAAKTRFYEREPSLRTLS